MRLLIECTYVFDHPYVNSGIQRVVRNIIRNVGMLPDGIECFPVVLKNDRVHRVGHFDPGLRERIVAVTQEWFETTRSRLWMLHHRCDRFPPVARTPALRVVVKTLFRIGAFGYILPFAFVMLLLARARIHDRTQPWFERREIRYREFQARVEARPGTMYRLCRPLFRCLFRLFGLSFRLPDACIRHMARHGTDDKRLSEIDCRPGDLLVLLDSSWHADFFAHAGRLKAQGLGIVAVIYDLIPLTHPQFCDAPLVKVFDRWFDWVADTADGFIAISATIAGQVREDMVRRIGAEAAGKRWYDHFHLGTELDAIHPAGRVRQRVKSTFAPEHPIYLMVGTIEPRKNHGYLLDAFDRLWRDGLPVCLCIVGRIGWKCADLVTRIRTHPELGRRLFMLNGLDDNELEYCYRHSKALVFPSHVEGFGLPLVEAMQRGLPAMVSDIAVFREVGGDFAAYFDLADPDALGRLIRRFEEDGRFPAGRPVGEWRGLRWADSACELTGKILRHAVVAAAPASVAPAESR